MAFVDLTQMIELLDTTAAFEITSSMRELDYHSSKLIVLVPIQIPISFQPI